MQDGHTVRDFRGDLIIGVHEGVRELVVEVHLNDRVAFRQPVLAYGEIVVDVNDSLLTTGRPNRVFLFKLGINVSVQAGMGIFTLDDDVVFLDVRIACQCLPSEVGDLLVGRRLVRPARAQIVFHTPHADGMKGIAFGGTVRRQMTDVARQCDDAVIDLNLQSKAQHARIVFERALHGGADLVVGHRLVALTPQQWVGVPPVHVDAADIHILRTRTPRQILGIRFLKAAGHVAVDHDCRILDLHVQLHVVEKCREAVQLSNFSLQFGVGLFLLRVHEQIVLEFGDALRSHRHFTGQHFETIGRHSSGQRHLPIGRCDIDLQLVRGRIRLKCRPDILLEFRVVATGDHNLDFIDYRLDTANPLGQTHGDLFGQDVVQPTRQRDNAFGHIDIDQTTAEGRRSQQFILHRQLDDSIGEFG